MKRPLFVLTILYHLSLNFHQTNGLEHNDPTNGFIALPLNQSNFLIQRPYNVPQDTRYSFIHGVHKLWVYSTDKPHSITSKTRPRTEIHIHVSTEISFIYSSLTKFAFVSEFYLLFFHSLIKNKKKVIFRYFGQQKFGRKSGPFVI